MATFKQVIEQIEDIMAGSNSPLSGFGYTKEQAQYVWIHDPSKIIGEEQAHYEFLNGSGTEVTMNVDFEKQINGKPSYLSFEKTLTAIPADIQWVKRGNIKRLWYSTVFDLNDEDIVEKLAGALKYVDDHLGDQIRSILKLGSTRTIKQTQGTEMNKMPLNQILYGPPGTGKTYTLLSEYFPRFTSAADDISDEQYHIDLIGQYTWWHAVGAALMELGTVEVTKILEHPIVQAKNSISNQKDPRAMVWSMLQRHTTPDNQFVKYGIREEPYLFDKDAQKKWSIDKTAVETEAPEINDLLKEWNNKPGGGEVGLLRYEFVTFHQSFSYEDFVEGIKPVMGDDVSELLYEVEPGVFKNICQRASLDPENDYALFIDEINRGNVSQILGELITLIEDDKRTGNENAMSIMLPYSKTEFSVPNNLYIIGTMNTADRSIEALDTALRRRFSFVEMAPQPDLLSPPNIFWRFLWKHEHKSWDTEPYKSLEAKVFSFLGASDKIWNARKDAWAKMTAKNPNSSPISLFPELEFTGMNLKDLLIIINKRIEKLLSKDHMIGHAYFMGVYSLQGLKETFQDKIVPLLQEYFYGDYGKIGLVLGSGFFKDEEEADEDIFAEFERYDAEGLAQRATYQLLPVTKMTDEDFKIALDSLLGKKL